MANKNKFTAGPWKINEHEPTEIRGCGTANDWVAETHWMYSKRGKAITPKELANARLIAAAPDLLAALELALEEIHQGMDYDGPNAYPSTKRTVDVARAAIRKAKGE